jgi:hypothetical protein
MLRRSTAAMRRPGSRPTVAFTDIRDLGDDRLLVI